MRTYIDLNAMLHVKNAPLLLPSNIATFLYENKSNYLTPKENHDQLILNLPLVKSGHSQWHIIGKAISNGHFATVYESHFKIILKRDKQESLVAEVVLANDVVKIQRANLKTTHEKLLKCAQQEALYQQKHWVDVSAVVDTGREVITVLENCGIDLCRLLPFNFLNHPNILSHCLEIICRILNEMLLLQQNNIVHRDLKLENICYKSISDASGKEIVRIIFIDFGFAKEADMRENVISGTINYIAPEVMAGFGSSYASDIYSLVGVLAVLLGAKDVFDDKLQFTHLRDVANAPYRLINLFQNYNVSREDPFLLGDIKILLMAMQNPNPKSRPPLEVVNKFFTLVKARQEQYKVFRANWDILAQNFYQLDAHYAKLEYLQNHNSVMPLHLLNDSNPFSNSFAKELTRARSRIYKRLDALWQTPKSHYQLARRLVLENRVADFEEQDKPYPSLKELNELLCKENAKLKQVLDGFKILTTYSKSSKKLKLVMQVLQKTSAPSEKMGALKTIAHKYKRIQAVSSTGYGKFNEFTLFAQKEMNFSTNSPEKYNSLLKQ
ncbi:MAG: protein kinase [Legionella sp.]|uniref:protein kinase domain-containing protein n=1 Tax=Legionella sp. TaxID=459 RepID=UPI0039E60E68